MCVMIYCSAQINCITMITLTFHFLSVLLPITEILYRIYHIDGKHISDIHNYFFKMNVNLQTIGT